MGKKDKKRKDKKVTGAEKTAAKTEKKATQKLKKELRLKGEEDIEKLIAEVQELDRKRLEVTEDVVTPPSPRSNFSFVAHPEKDELILFGGEFFNGSKTLVYNDLFIYNIKKNEWILVKSPNAPPPRSAHQALILPRGGGELWIFGGEFTSPSQSQFYHYKDLWVFRTSTRRWEKIAASGGPSSRSGHRMVACKKHLIVFGGFHDNGRDYKYFNDVYTFDSETLKWQKPEVHGTPPTPRSGFVMAPLSDGRILIYGGYSKDRLKKDVDKGIVHSDMFLLQPDKGEPSSGEWFWTRVKHGGCKPSPRSGCTMAVLPNDDRAYVFGGVYDTESEETLEGTFYDELYRLDLDLRKWYRVAPRGKGEVEKKRRRRVANETEEETDRLEECSARDERVSKVEQIHSDSETDSPLPSRVTTVEDGIFTLTIGPLNASTSCEGTEADADEPTSRFVPRARMNAGLALKRGVLYLYGGVYEANEKEITLADFHCLDLHRLDEWRTLIEYDDEQQEWIDSECSEAEESEDDDDDDEDGADGSDDDDARSDKLEDGLAEETPKNVVEIA